ncbi:hypothetical protein [Paenirhodobacter populi]|uniref:hypothetical protein n=1 Tax=Paenirhodobacter populi TaxID=2306993 RepID=UPI0013E36479|nr:hypothetical protein [Sinirhodobacter populi]
MSIWLEAAKRARCQTDRTDKTPSNRPDPIPRPDASVEVLSVLSVCQFKGDSPSGPADPPRAPPRQNTDAFPYGRNFDGRPRTWTGKVVSLDEWRRLSDWDKHGSSGKVWNGITRQWEPMDGGAA